ncbi:MAG: hypothetical protein EOS73_29250 [Mesorhizobium sp.]|nr:MAG: hypothetical protein EOS27_31480 [Mesorhizobium sp.]RWC99023.1 MAG: hypothetical protein EOS73_29250 [Mesorhizobium sp.]
MTGQHLGTISACRVLTIFSANRKRRPPELLSQRAFNLGGIRSDTGFLARISRPMFRVVTRSWHMYPVGFRFGLSLIGETIAASDNRVRFLDYLAGLFRLPRISGS